MIRPSETLCPVCQTIFLQPIRVHGGGTRKKYCSSKCRSLDWVRGNGGKRQAHVLKYDALPVNKHKKRLRARRGVLRKHGWTEADFQRELFRQGWVCYGCLTSLSDGTIESTPVAHIDHDHTTDNIRGLLCNTCNLGLGYLYDDPVILRRLMAYLDRDRTKQMIYVAGALKNTRIPEIGNALRAKGFDAMDEWFTPGPDADTNWQAYEKTRGRSFGAALQGRSATNIFLFDRSYIDMCDAFVLVLPAGKSGMLELGYASARKQTYVLLDGHEIERYDVMTRAAITVCATVEELIDVLG